MTNEREERGSLPDPDWDRRYIRQAQLDVVGPGGQERIQAASVLVVGCGALGSHIADGLVRAGVGSLVVVDRDVVEPSNLHRQSLFGEEDARRRVPKAVAAAERLRSFNSTVAVEGHVADVTARNLQELVAAADIVLDGTDNLETRYLINDACVEADVPWVYGGAVGTVGATMTVLPGRGPCFRCLTPDPPPPGALDTCETAGILGSVAATVAALQVASALRWLVTGWERPGRLVQVDPWAERYVTVDVVRSATCPCCAQRHFEFLAQRRTAWTTALCSRNAVQITPPDDQPETDLEALRERLESVGRVHYNGMTLTAWLEDHEVIIFPDGRVVVKGTTDVARARALHARYLG